MMPDLRTGVRRSGQCTPHLACGWLRPQMLVIRLQTEEKTLAQLKAVSPIFGRGDGRPTNEESRARDFDL